MIDENRLSDHERRLLKAMRQSGADLGALHDAMGEAMRKAFNLPREVVVNGQRFLVCRDARGEYYQPVTDEGRGR